MITAASVPADHRWRDTDLNPQERVKSLAKVMTLRDKLAQARTLHIPRQHSTVVCS